MSPLIPIGAGLAAIAYFALSSKSASAATSPSYPSAPGGGGGGGSGGGGTTPSSPSSPSDGGGGAPYVDPSGTGVFPNTNPSGYVGPGVGTTSPTDSGGLPGAVSSGSSPSWTDSLASMFSAGGPSVGQGVDMGWHFSQHPNVMAVTGGRGGWVPNYDGCAEGYAPPGGLPIH